MNQRILYKIDAIIFILIFVAAIYIPFILGMVQEDHVSSPIEKRNLARMPGIPKSLAALKEYPQAFNTYYADHFGLRDVFTRKYFRLEKKFNDRSSMDDVTIGQDGWLFLGSIKPGYDGYNDPMGDAINVNLFTEQELQKFAKYIMAYKNWLASKGIEYIYVIAPNKHTIYFEKLPEYISKKNATSATDQLVDYLWVHTDINVVDLRPILLMEKKKHQVYFKTDTHWNQYGANAAQFAILEKIKSLFPEQIKPSLIADTDFQQSTRGGGDLAAFAKIENIVENSPQPVFKSDCNPVIEQPIINPLDTFTTVCNVQRLNIVIFRDSFFSALQPYVSRHFHRATYIWEKINTPALQKYVEQEKPDIVIEEVVERFLPYTPSKLDFKGGK